MAAVAAVNKRTAASVLVFMMFSLERRRPLFGPIDCAADQKPIPGGPQQPTVIVAAREEL
jgi:hypothetical protein